MNYRKTKTIQKVAMERKGFLGILVLFFLLVNCQNGHTGGMGGERNNLVPVDPFHKENAIAKNLFMTEKVGYFSDCGKNCLERQLIEDAQNNKDKNNNVLTRKDSYGVKDTAYLPKTKDKIRYFAQIARQPVVGDKERRDSAKATKRKRGELRIDEGVQGAMVQMFEEFLGTKNSKTAKHPRFYVIANYMDLSEKTRKVLLDTTKTKEEIIEQLRADLAVFVEKVSKVRPGASGIEMIIPTTLTKDSTIEYQEPKKGTFVEKIKKAKVKHYTLDRDLEKKLDAAIQRVQEGIDQLENSLKVAPVAQN